MIDLNRPQKKEAEESAGAVILMLMPFMVLFFALFVRAL